MQSSPLPLQLGNLLKKEGTIRAEQLKKALKQQQTSGGKIGKILYSLGFCNQLQLYQTLARQQGRLFVNLEEQPPNAALLTESDIPDYLRFELLPWKEEASGETLLATPQPSAEAESWARERYGLSGYRWAITSPRDIRKALTNQFESYFTRQSCEKLWIEQPDLSARSRVISYRSPILICLLTLLFLALIIFPVESFLAVLLFASSFCLATLLFKAALFWKGVFSLPLAMQQADAPTIDDKDLPIYTILVPLYDEAASLPRLIHNLKALDYPAEKLDIKLILEADDHPTIGAAKALQPDGRFELVTVPPSQPRTKPKACNYALPFARGEFVTIYDAEDKPDPQQLRKVVSAFRHGSDKLVCIQCRLNYYNRGSNLLTALFSIEYAAWFNYMLVALEHYRMPLPLGGTSNHIYRQRLIELGEWDPYNVTEDADLGVRLASFKYRTGTLDSLTLEEAPVTLWSWIKQRSRWIKGHLQTWLVHMRQPLKLYKKLGASGFWGFQFFIGGPCLMFLATPFLILASLLFFNADLSDYPGLSMLVLSLSLLVLIFSVLLHSIMALVVLWQHGWRDAIPAAILFPFYWILHSLASFRSLWQLFTRPHYWDKTSHGHSLTA